MSRIILIFSLTIIVTQCFISRTRSSTIGLCEDLLSSRKWTRTAYLKFLCLRCQWQGRSFALSAEDAEYYFYQQEKYRECLAEQLNVGAKESITYFKKSYSEQSALKSAEHFCDDSKNVSELRGHCRKALENTQFLKQFNVLPLYLEKPECTTKHVELTTYPRPEDLMIKRKVLQCPVMIRNKNDEPLDYKSGVYISCADDSVYNGSLVYVFTSRETTTAYLKVISLLVNWQLKMADAIGL